MTTGRGHVVVVALVDIHRSYRLMQHHGQFSRGAMNSVNIVKYGPRADWRAEPGSAIARIDSRRCGLRSNHHGRRRLPFLRESVP